LAQTRDPRFRGGPGQESEGNQTFQRSFLEAAVMAQSDPIAELGEGQPVQRSIG
jgi:hypothetical protein